MKILMAFLRGAESNVQRLSIYNDMEDTINKRSHVVLIAALLQSVKNNV